MMNLYIHDTPYGTILGSTNDNERDQFAAIYLLIDVVVYKAFWMIPLTIQLFVTLKR